MDAGVQSRSIVKKHVFKTHERSIVGVYSREESEYCLPIGFLSGKAIEKCERIFDFVELFAFEEKFEAYVWNLY